MKKNKCLYCYQELTPKDLDSAAGVKGFHQKCSKKFFGKSIPPELNIDKDQIFELAQRVIKSQKTVTGVQPKLSLGITKETEKPDKFTIVGVLGEYILKPPSDKWFSLPENEDLTMHLAEISRIQVVDHSLIRLKSGELSYITKRIDRVNGKKLHMEDMCQITERLTEHKYKGSYEQISKAIRKHVINPGLDVTNFFEMVLFSFLTGNNDMHLKNFSLLKRPIGYSLSPVYDLLSSELVVIGDDEELALNLNGKKKKLKRNDFEVSMKGSGLNEKVIENIFARFEKIIPKWFIFIDNSFLPETTIKEYKDLIERKANQLNLKIQK